jgi:hypothetical protein
MRKLVLASAALALTAPIGVGVARADARVNNELENFTTSGTVYDAGAPNDPVNLGDLFTATADISVDALGFYDQPGLTGPETVALYTSTGTLLLSVSVPDSGSTVGGYFFKSIAPVALTEGNLYTVDAFTGNNDWSYGFTYPNQAPGATYDGHAYVYTNSLEFPTNTVDFAGGPTGVYYGPNFEYSSAIPEPSIWAMLLVGFGTFGFVGHRKAKGGPHGLRLRVIDRFADSKTNTRS